MQPIYQTIAGELQCVMHEGQLMVREWPEGTPSSDFGRNERPWTPSSHTEAAIREGLDSIKDVRTRFRLGCMLDCFTGKRPSGWYMKPKSEALAEKIEAFMVEREEALKAEIADRPVAITGSLFEGEAAS